MTTAVATLPRVSKILDDADVKTPMDFVPPSALHRGTMVHKYLEFYELGKLDESKVDPQIQPYLDAWKRFRREAKIEVLAVEEEVVNEPLGYQGRLDLRLRFNGKPGVADWKGGKPQSRHRLQLSAYLACLDPEEYRGRWVIAFENGVYKPYEFTDRTDHQAWKYCVGLYHWKRRTA